MSLEHLTAEERGALNDLRAKLAEAKEYADRLEGKDQSVTTRDRAGIGQKLRRILQGEVK
jgi:uncharacterized protein YhaN